MWIKLLRQFATLGVILSIMAGFAFAVFNQTKGQFCRDGLVRLVRFQPLTIVRRFQVSAPDGINRIEQYMLDETTVHLAIERPDGYATVHKNLALSEYEALWKRLKSAVVPGTEEEIYVDRP